MNESKSNKTNVPGVSTSSAWKNRTSHVRHGKKYVGLITDFKKCGNCKEVRPLNVFMGNGNYRPDGASYVRHVCIECSKQLKQEARIAKRNAPYEKTEICECCGSTEYRIESDHIHGTTEFRGWICLQCNQGMGKLGDDLDGILRAAKYLAKGNLTMIVDKLKGVMNDPFKGTNMEGKD